MWKSGGFKAEYSTRAGVLYLTITGLVTPGVLKEFCRGGTGEEGGAYCLLARLDGAVLAMAADDFTSPFDLPEMAGRLQMPGAIVCSPDAEALFQRHARQCAERGIVRSVFTELSPATAWCQAKASAARRAFLGRLGRGLPSQEP